MFSKFSELRKRKHQNDTENDETADAEIQTSQAEISPEVLNIETRRSKRKKNHEKSQEDKKVKSKNRDKEEVAQYLKCWKDKSENWKYHKVKQVYIQNNIFDEKIIEDEIWQIALEYLSGTKGAGKEAILKSAQNVIKEIDDKNEDSDENSDVMKVKYKRARELMQMLN